MRGGKLFLAGPACFLSNASSGKPVLFSECRKRAPVSGRKAPHRTVWRKMAALVCWHCCRSARFAWEEHLRELRDDANAVKPKQLLKQYTGPKLPQCWLNVYNASPKLAKYCPDVSLLLGGKGMTEVRQCRHIQFEYSAVSLPWCLLPAT